MSEPPAAPDEGWRRTSPLSFAVRALVSLRPIAVAAAAVILGSRGWGEEGAAIVPPLILSIILVAGVVAWVAWRQFRYRVGEHDIRVEQGLLSRSARTVPYERIQDVSLEQSLIPRLFGMVQVKFETGAGGNDEITLAYVTQAQGEALRETVRARKLGETVGAADAPPEEEQAARRLFAMDTHRLLTFGVFEFSLVIFAVLGGAAQQFDFLLPFDIWDFDEWGRLLAGPSHRLAELGLAGQAIGAVLALGTLAVLGLATGIARTVLRDYGFLLEETPKGLRRRRGLLTRTDVVMPLHRVQALKVTTGIVRRRFGWHRLDVVSLAQDAKSESHVVVPFATMEEIAPVVRVAGFDLPGDSAQWRRASARHRRNNALLGAVPLLLAALAAPFLAALLPEEAQVSPWIPVAVLTCLAAVSALREHYLWRHERHAIDGARLYVRRGWLSPRLDIASRVKLQSVEIVQGPLGRRGGYADVKLGVAGGTLEVPGIPLEAARAIRAAVLESIAAVDFSRLPG